MASGPRSNIGEPSFEPEVFRKQIHCIEESTCYIVGSFRRSPQSFGASIVIRVPGNCATNAPPRCALGTGPSSESFKHICQNVWQLWFALNIFTKHYYLLARLNHLEISHVSWDKTYSTMLSFKLKRSLSTWANHLGFTKSSNCYYDTIICLKQLRCIIINTVFLIIAGSGLCIVLVFPN